jgi:branched-chain amino acid transport system permease protein
MSLNAVVQILVGGLAFGSVYALVAVGIVFIWRTMNLLNFAHGQFLLLCCYVAIISLYQKLGWPISASVLVALLIVGLFGTMFATTVFERLRKQPLLTSVIATMGLSLVLENAVLLLFGPRPYSFEGFLGRKMIWIGNVGFLANHVFALLVSLIILIVFASVLKYTIIGRAIRAVAYDKETAGLMGIPVPWLLSLMFGFSAILAGLAGILVVPVTYLTLDLGTAVGYKAFASVVIGGFGSVPGAIIGGYIVGLLEGAGTAILGTAYRDLLAFAVMLLVLFLRPSGILGIGEAERI